MIDGIMKKSQDRFSLKEIFRQFPLKIIFTLTMSIAESVSILLLPLTIGMALNSLAEGNYYGLTGLGIIGCAILIFGSGRRFADTRIYASIYEDVASQLIEKETAKGSSVSLINGRVNLLSELVTFFEEDFPGILENTIGLSGTLLILWFADYRIFLLCIAIMIIAVIVYGVSAGKNIHYNREYNNCCETQVDALAGGKSMAGAHFRKLMKWNIKLSDLETLNFSIMYVLGFMEVSIILPLYGQQLFRLKEISDRLNYTER